MGCCSSDSSNIQSNKKRRIKSKRNEGINVEKKINKKGDESQKEDKAKLCKEKINNFDQPGDNKKKEQQNSINQNNKKNILKNSNNQQQSIFKKDNQININIIEKNLSSNKSKYVCTGVNNFYFLKENRLNNNPAFNANMESNKKTNNYIKNQKKNIKVNSNNNNSFYIKNIENMPIIESKFSINKSNLLQNDFNNSANLKFDELFRTDFKGNMIKTKEKFCIRFYMKKPNLYLNCLVYKDKIKDKDIKCFILRRKDYIDIHFIFQHKGNYKAFLYPKENNNLLNFKEEYNFECEEEWGNKQFTFPIELIELYDSTFEERLENFKCDEISHKNIIFNAKNREKLSFKFKSDSNIIITKIHLYNIVNEKCEDELKKVVKYYLKDKNLDIEIILNKKGKYKLSIYYFDNDLFEGKKENVYSRSKTINYYVNVESDSKEHEEYSYEEMLITEPFEGILNKLKLNYISHKEQKIISKGVENFEFELGKNSIYQIEYKFFPENSKSIYIKQKKINNREVFYFTFDENIKYIITFNFKIFGFCLYKIVYIIDLTKFFANSQKIRKNIIETLDKENIKKIVLSCKKRTEISLYNFVVHLKEVTKNLKDEEKAYGLYFWLADNILYDVQGYNSGNMKCDPQDVYSNGYGVCSGYSILFEYIGSYLGLYVRCVSGYAKNDNKINNILTSNHEWNILKIDNIFYHIDSTWGAGFLKDGKFEKKFSEKYFCPEPELFIFTHYPLENRWQLISPNISSEEFFKRVKLDPFFFDLFKTDFIYHTIKVKNKTIIRFYKKKDEVKFCQEFYDEKNNKTIDIKCLVNDKKNYVDLIYIFKHKGKYSVEIYANEKNKNINNYMVTYYFESEEEWGEKIFGFSLVDMMDKLECEYISHKNIEFEAENREKLSFKFKPDSNISVDSVNLYFDGQYNKIMKVVKYYLKNKQLDIDIIFNKKGRYKIVIYFYDNSSSKNTLLDYNDLTYYAIVKSDAKEYKEFSDEEILMNQPF